MEDLLSWRRMFQGFFRRLGRYWLPCGLLSLLAFLPLAGLSLLSPSGYGEHDWWEFALQAVLLCRFLTPMAACLIVTYLARQDGRCAPETSLRRGLTMTPAAVGLVLAVWGFTGLASLFLVLPGLSFLLGSSVALPILVVEKTSVPEAARRSWERTRHVRDSLLLFWSVFLVLSAALLSLVALASGGVRLEELWVEPWAESAAFLPLVFACSMIYAAAICAVYELYRLLDVTDFERPPTTEEPS